MFNAACLQENKSSMLHVINNRNFQFECTIKDTKAVYANERKSGDN